LYSISVWLGEITILAMEFFAAVGILANGKRRSEQPSKSTMPRSPQSHKIPVQLEAMLAVLACAACGEVLRQAVIHGVILLLIFRCFGFWVWYFALPFAGGEDANSGKNRDIREEGKRGG